MRWLVNNLFERSCLLTSTVSGRHTNKCCEILLRPQYVHYPTFGVICMQRGWSKIFFICSFQAIDCVQVIEQYFFPHEAFNPQRHLLFTTSILFAALFGMCITFTLHIFTDYCHPVSLVTCDLGVMLEITGGISATALAYIFPPACFLWLSSPTKPWYSRTKLPAVICVAFGCVVMCLSLFLALGKVWKPDGDAKICM